MTTIGAPISPQMMRFLKARKACVDLMGQMDKIESATADSLFELLAIGTELRRIHTQFEVGAGAS